MAVADVVPRLEAADRPLLVTHRHADRDSLGSALGLAALLDADATICTPDGVAGPAQSLVENTETVGSSRDVDADVVVVLDAPSTERIAPVDPTGQQLVLVDHHTRGDLDEMATASLIDEDARSTAELVYRVATAADWPLTSAAAYPLVVGILDDTGFLQSAAPDQIRYVCELLPLMDGREADLARLFDPNPQPGERMARLKATARARFYRAGPVVLGISHVGGFETAAAHALREAGVDCALVWSEQSDHVRVVGRCTAAFADTASLGDELLPALGTAHDGSGGGHHTAGVARLDDEAVRGADRTEAIKRAVEERTGSQFHPLDE